MKEKWIYLEWEDSHHQAGWLEKNETEEFLKEEFIIKEVGYVVKENKRGIFLAQYIRKENNWFSHQNGGLHFIPKTWIRKKRILKIN